MGKADKLRRNLNLRVARELECPFLTDEEGSNVSLQTNSRHHLSRRELATAD